MDGTLTLCTKPDGRFLCGIVTADGDCPKHPRPVRTCHAGHVLFDVPRCDMPAGHTGYHTDGYISWVGRERWRFAGRDWTADGIPFYVWQLRNLDGSLNSSWVAPVSDLLRPWVAEREGE